MRVLAKVFRPFQRAAVAFFSHDVTVRRSREGLKVVLQARDAPGKPGLGKREQAQLEKEQAELQLMLAELGALLDQQPGSRQTLRHVDFVRQALQKKGLRALHQVPLDVLQRALEQFESLVSNWSPVGLASLRSKMAVAIIDREHINPDAEADAYRTTGVIDSLPAIPALPDVEVRSDDDALAAAYAALAGARPAGPVELQPDLGARSAKSVATASAQRAGSPEELELRALEH
jgi:hypothetical protein